MMAGMRLWSAIDRSFHDGASLLSDEDVCMFLMERMHGGYERCDANQLIVNLKMGVNVPENRLPHRSRAIQRFSKDLASLICQLGYDGRIVLVPIPPSKSRSDQEYDGRIVEVCKGAADISGVDYADVLYQLNSTKSCHSGGGTRDVELIYRNLGICDQGSVGDYDVVILVDDVITTGAHYLACKRKILNRFPGVYVVGAFWARQMTHDEEARM